MSKTGEIIVTLLYGLPWLVLLVGIVLAVWWFLLAVVARRVK